MTKFRVGGGLIKSKYEHQQDINIFFTGESFELYWEVNKAIYDQYFADPFEEEIAKGLLEPLNFFNTLYEQADVLTRYYHKPFDVISHLKSLELDEVRFHLLLMCLYNLHNGLYTLTIGVEENKRERISKNIDMCFHFILREGRVLHKKLYGEEPSFALEYDHVVPVLDTIKAPEEKIRYLSERISFCKKEVVKTPDIYPNGGSAFVQCCEIEIEHIKRLKAEGLHNSVTEQPQADVNTSDSRPAKNNIKKESYLLRYGYAKNQVLQYFMQLSRYYTEEQVMGFLKANFEGFAEPGEQVKKVKLPIHRSLDKQHIMYMVQCFWLLQKEPQFKRKAAAVLLEDNFACFESFDITSNKPIEKRTVYSNMGKKPKKDYPFSDTKLL